MTWQYVVRNTGTLNLTGVVVTDDKAVAVNCNAQTTLAAGATMTCTGTGVVTAIGPYRNVGTVTANWTSSSGLGSVTDADPSNYLGITPIEIQKLTNGDDADDAPGPSIVVGSAVTWEYRSTNVGSVPLTAVAVVDDRARRDVRTDDARSGGDADVHGLRRRRPWSVREHRNRDRTLGERRVVGQCHRVRSEPLPWSHSRRRRRQGDALSQDGRWVLREDQRERRRGTRAPGARRAMPGEAVPNLPGKSFTASCGVQ